MITVLLLLLQKVENYKKIKIFYIFLVIYEQKSPSTANIYIYRRIIFQLKLFFLDKEVLMINNWILKVERRIVVWKRKNQEKMLALMY